MKSNNGVIIHTGLFHRIFLKNANTEKLVIDSDSENVLCKKNSKLTFSLDKNQQPFIHIVNDVDEEIGIVRSRKNVEFEESSTGIMSSMKYYFHVRTGDKFELSEEHVMDIKFFEILNQIYFVFSIWHVSDDAETHHDTGSHRTRPSSFEGHSAGGGIGR